VARGPLSGPFDNMKWPACGGKYGLKKKNRAYKSKNGIEFIFRLVYS